MAVRGQRLPRGCSHDRAISAAGMSPHAGSNLLAADCYRRCVAPDSPISPSADTLNATLSEIANQNARGAVIVGAAQIEKYLALAMTHHFAGRGRPN